MTGSEMLGKTIELFALIDPIGAVPIFLAITAGWSEQERRRTALVASLTIVAILVVFAYVGSYILEFFGISIAAFTLSGGLLIGALAASMLRAHDTPMRQKPEEVAEAHDRHLHGLVPLGIPLLSGPAAIANILVSAQQAGGGVTGPSYLLLPILVVAALTLIIFYLAGPIGRLLGRTGINVLTRLLGMLLLALSVQLVANGIYGLFPALLAAP